MRKSIIIITVILIFVFGTGCDRSLGSSETSSLRTTESIFTSSNPIITGEISVGSETKITENSESSLNSDVTTEPSITVNITQSSVYTTVPTPIPVLGIVIDKTSAVLDIGSSIQLRATITPNNATDKAVTWRSENQSIATVSGNGLVTAKATGTAIIIAKSSNGKTATCKITVNSTKTKSAYDRPYDISAIEADLAKYVRSLGLIYENDMTPDTCGHWADPLYTNDRWQGEKLKNLLVGDIEFRKQQGIYNIIRVYFQPHNNNEFKVIILCGG